MLSDGLCNSIALLTFVILIRYNHSTFAALQGLYPPVSDLSSFKPVNASSTCGLENKEMKYCGSSINNASLTTCTQLSCLLDCCTTCGKSQPSSTNVLSGTENSVRQSTDVRPGSAANSHSKSFTVGSYISHSNLAAANVPQLGLSFAAWIKQTVGNSGALFSKGNFYTFILKHYDIDFKYSTRDAPSVSRNYTLRNINLVQGRWQHVAFVIFNRHLSVFTDGLIQRTVVLDGVINDATSVLRIGQRADGTHQFTGLVQEAKFFVKGLTNREVTEAMNGTLPAVYGYSYCRCPPSHPRIAITNPLLCIENGASAATHLGVTRLSETSHPPEYLIDNSVIYHWISGIVENATIDINLIYRELQVFQVQIMFYSPPARGIKIERSVDGGRTYTPWQYYAEDCQRMFGLENNGALTQPDSVNCLQILSPVKSDFETFTFQTQEPGPQNKPQRPIGEAGCSDFHCSPKLLQFVKATNVRISFYQHMLVTNLLHNYFGIRRILVTGTCDCYGHGEACTMHNANATHNASYTCTCDSRTFTEGSQCQRCKPLYQDKPFRRGMVLNAYPCKKCQCNDHALSCTYNSGLDSDPNNREIQGGGVCDNCMHNTTGRFCNTCKTKFYRPSGKPLNALDVCSPCNCVGAGVLTQNSDCQRDASNSSILAGQCPCKLYASGRQCTKCRDGYYYLTASNPEGCIACECNSLGTQRGNISCDLLTGQCNCKTNVERLKCSRCKTGFYGLSASNPEGCTACNCDPWGSTSGNCDINSGQCPCKTSTEGLRCHSCKNGYYGLASDGCKVCRCNIDGTDPARLNLCDKTSGNCFCRQYVEGNFCDRCKVGHYNLSRHHSSGCLPCNCDAKGTIGNAGQCNQLNGTCTCKSSVYGRQCNLCKTGTFNLSSAIPEGCSRCNCNPKGTVDGGTTPQGSLPCFNTGQCNCLTNVVGLRCDRCVDGYYWNPTGFGCIPCNCDLQGSESNTCNTTGYCSCRVANGVGGQRCDQCLPGYYGFSNGRCNACGCSPAGSLQLTCDSTGKCTSCKRNVQGNKCDQCKPGTSNLQSSNSYGCSGPPSEQGPPLISNITSRSMLVSWFPPDNPNGLILYYNLFRNNSMTYNGSATSYNDTGLTPYSLYTYYVMVFTAGGSAKSVDSDRSYRTLTSIPQGVQKPQASNVLARSIILTWVPPEKPNGPIVSYRLSSTHSLNTNPVIHYTGPLRSFQVTGLTPFTVYNFTLVACTTAGCAQSEITSQATRSAAPDSQPAPYVTPLADGRSVFVFWDAPSQPNGVILFYDLYMRQAPFTSAGTTQAVKLNPSQRNYTVTGLMPYTEYEFRVVSYTAQVSGDTTSTWTRHRTLESAPTGSEYVSPRGRPVTSKSVNLTWYAPRFPNGVILRYEVYRYELADLSTPILSTSTNGRLQTALVTGLTPYTSYQFSVKACNSKGCTSQSSRVTVVTLPDVPSGQGFPNITALNSSAVSLTWSQPSILNGPLPVGYEIERTFASLHTPPPQVEAGIRFSSFGYYKFSPSLIPDSYETRLEFNVRTTYPDGLVFYAASIFQEDMFAVEIRSGKPWFIFDTESGPAAFTVSTSVRIDDGRWHKVLVTRMGRSGTIVVDDVYSGSGLGGGSTNIIGQISTVYVGGLPNGFRILRSDTGNAVLKRYSLVGCLKNVKYKNSIIDFNTAIERSNVDPLYTHCPTGLSSGLYFKGGGYISLRSGLFTGSSIFVIRVMLRTTFKSGLILFAHGTGTTSVAVMLDNGNITVAFRSPTQSGFDSTVFPQVCDGNWHNLTITGFSSVASIYIDGISKNFKSLPSDAVFNSVLYLGGVPQGSQADTLIQTLVGRRVRSFGGCMRNVAFSNSIVLQRDLIAHLNVALDGCPADFTSTTAIATCTDPVYSTVQRTSSKFTEDHNLLTFTEYLYRVKSYRNGIHGYSNSIWMPIRTKEGAPNGVSPPAVDVISARYISMTWTRPNISGGLITKYQIKAYNHNNISAPVILTEINNINLRAFNLTGLDPYTMYGLSIVAFTSGGSTESRQVNVTTTEANPELLQPATAIAYPRALFISWQPPVKPNGLVRFYQLNVNGIPKYFGRVGFHVNVTGLSVYTSYSVQLSACNSKGCAHSTTSIFTGQLPPTGIHAPQLRVLGSRRIDVTWNRPDVLNGVISKYEIQVAQNDVSARYNVSYTARPDSFHTILANLTPGTLYYIRIAAYTAGGPGIGNVSSAKTFESAPEDIPNPTAIAISSSIINVTIETPRKPNGVIIYYVLFQDDIAVKNDTNLHFQGTGFLPYSRHTYRTRACTAKGCGESDLTVVYTLDAQPIGNVTLEANVTSPRSFQARWTAVQIPNGIIKYSLMVSGEFYITANREGDLSSYQTRTMIKMAYNGSLVNSVYVYSGLLPYSRYTAQVNASNRAGFVLSNQVTFSTPAAAPDGVISPVILHVNSTTLNVTWTAPGRANGIILSYKLIGLYPLNDGSASSRQVDLGSGMMYHSLVHGLQPYTNYSFKIVVNGSGGISESIWSNITTLEDIPEHVDQPKIVNIESRSVFVEISAPSKPNGRIIHYIIYLNGTEKNRTLLTRFTVFDLQPFSFYNSRIEACTLIGCRSSATTRFFQTLQDVPKGQPAPNLIANGSRSVVVSWLKPQSTNGIILSYQIQRKMRGILHPVSIAFVNASTSSNIYVDRTVKPWTTYEYRVIARTIAGGTPGPYSSVTTPEGDPEGIAPPNVTAVSSSSLLVHWSPPSIPNGHVTHYYIKTTGRQELVNRTTSLSITLDGLGSYIEYPVVVSACTIGGCGDSLPTTARTLTSSPGGQMPPSAEVLSSTSLRVRWSVPTHPNGPIVSFVLRRRTVEDPVSSDPSASVVYPTDWVIVFSGSRQVIDDAGLGIYSLQQYQVTAITTVGNTTSNSSIPYRTGAAAPLQGVNLTATAIDHATVRLSWTVPPVRTLRGPVVRFDVSYEIVDGPAFAPKSLAGNLTETIIRDLRPSTRYAFKISIFNGAGSMDSSKALAKTLDGSPDGFDPPSVYVVSATELRISWTAPRVPNGAIYNYTIFGNSKPYDTVSAATFTHLQQGFKPYTVYAVQVRVCTLYSCTMSTSVTARTLQAAPGLINPPTLEPLSSTSIQVRWQTPVEPNGIITGYKLFRRKVFNCPTTPIPIRKCTYVVCSVNEEVCAGKCFNPRIQKCCNGTLHALDATKTCCGNNYIRKNSNSDVCCGGRFLVQQNGYQCCHGYYTRVPTGHVCCRGPRGVVVGLGNSCCGDVPFDINGDKSCICGALYNKNPAIRKCCGGKVVSIAQHCCGNETVGMAYDYDAGKSCCGTSYVNATASLCCQNSIGQSKAYQHANVAEISQVKCCGTNRIPRTSSCCNNQSYDNATEVCSDRSSFGQIDCGTGRTCPKNGASQAYCDRCNFNPSSSICSSVSGYFDTAASGTNNSVKLCFSNYTELLRNPTDPGIRAFVDSGLEPHTLYDYYVIAINNLGNSSSRSNRTRTLMATPEGIPRPQATVLSSNRIAVTWSAPAKPNGVIVSYTLYRIKWDTKEEVVVFTGLSFSHTDSQSLEPYTGYLYKISVCTVLCANQSAAALVYTEQAAPQNVLPPVLTAVSSTSIQVNWSLPGNPNGIIRNYTVTILSNGTYTSILPRGDLGLALTKIVVGLKPFTMYTFQVQACTIAGCTLGPNAQIRTLQARPQGVTKPSVTIINARTAEIEWRQPAVVNGILLRYVLYRNSTAVYNGILKIYRDKGLTPNTIYAYEIEAFTSGGGSRSAATYVRMPESSPEGIAAPTIIPITSSQLRVTWNAPSRPNGVVIRYEVIYNQPGLNILRVPAQSFSSHTIGSLKPYTLYEVRIQACTAQGCGTSNRTLNRTLEAAPTGQSAPTLSVKSSSIIELSWAPPASPNGVILKYEVTRKELNAALEYVIYVGQALVYIDTGLKPYTVYQYKVKSRNSAGFDQSPWSSIRTRSGVPQGLIAPMITVISGVSVQVTWQQPTQPNGLITGFEVRARKQNQIGNETTVLCCISASTLNVTVTGLLPATTYEFRIAARSSGGVGYSDWTIARTKEAPPFGISTLRANTNPDGLGDGKSLQVLWGPPSIPNGVITNYRLYLDTFVVYEGLLLQSIIRRLQPYTNYSFQLEVCNSAGCTKGPYQLLLTAEVAPNGQLPPGFGMVNGTSVTINWKPPLYPNGFILRYDILRRTSSSQRRRRRVVESVIYSTNKTRQASYSFTDTGLLPFTTYEYKTRTINSKGSIDSDWATVKTAASSPTGFSTPNATALGSYSVQLQWSPPTSPNGIVQYYEVYRNNSLRRTGSVLTFTDMNLNPVTLYRYSVRVCTYGGCTMSQGVHVITHAATPGEMRPPKLRALDSTRINATWTVPSVSNGEILKYQLRIAKNIQPVFEGLAYQYVISGLDPYTIYSVTITACTSSGCGAHSIAATTQTLEASPQNLLPPSLFVLGSSTIQATWSPPVTPNGVILYYTLRRDNIVVYNGTYLSFFDRTVSPGTRYAYTISCSNRAGSVTSLPQQSPITNPSAPENVSTPVLRALSSSSVEVRWLPPKKPNGVITRYYVLYENMKLDANTRLHLNVSDLKFFTMYEFRIMACTVAGCSNGLPASIRTLEAPPASQSPPTFNNANIGARFVFVQWIQPLKPNGIITHYELRRRQGSNTVLVNTGPLQSYNDTSSVLQPNTAYEYQIMSFNRAGSATSSWAPVVTKIARPEQVKAVVVLQQDIRHNSFVFSVEEPVKPNGRISRYIIELIGLKNITLISVMRGEATGLSPYTTYSVKVFACNSAGCSSSSIKQVTTAVATPIGFNNAPVAVSKTSRSILLRWQPPSIPNGPSPWYQINQRYTCPQSSMPLSLCTAKQNSINASQATEYNITSLLPFVLYRFTITVRNSAGSAVSPEAAVKTMAENPVVLRAPNVTVKGYQVNIDWTRSFDLRSELDGYILEENFIQTYSGNKLKITLPTRDVGVYAYVVRVSTLVNGKKVTVTAPMVKVNVGDVAPTTVPVSSSAVWYKQVWFLSIAALLAVILVLCCIAILLKRLTRERNVYIRERDPLPLKPKSKMGSRSGSRSTLDASSFKGFPYLETPTPKRKPQDMLPMTSNLYSSRTELIGNSPRISQTPLDEKLSLSGLDEQTWDNFMKGYNPNGKDRDSGLFDENVSPTSNDDDEPLSLHSFQNKRILFPDTHL